MKSLMIAIILSIASVSIASAEVYDELQKVAYSNGSIICHDYFDSGSLEFYQCIAKFEESTKINKGMFDKVMPKYKKEINKVKSLEDIKQFPIIVRVVFYCLNDAHYYSYYDETYGFTQTGHDSVDTANCIDDNLGKYVFNQ